MWIFDSWFCVKVEGQIGEKYDPYADKEETRCL